ncbi:ABC transporter ATP-binding protein [Novispirillum sp. DQ9]|uniref:ABC transporter ATP-binding protein n=1 Tax=Novispirillum sp. DQ9 TaxID=3398612 RepID=UPI003C7E6D3C
MTTRGRSAYGLYMRALREARPWWPHLGVVALLGVLATPLGLLGPLSFQIIIDHVIGSEPLPGYLRALLPAGTEAGTEPVLWFALLFGLGIAAAGLLHGTADWLYREWVGEGMVRAFRGRLFARSLRVTHGKGADEGAMDAALRISNDAPALQWTALYGFIPLLTSLVALGVTLSVVLAIHPTVAAIALATTVPAVILIHSQQRRMSDRWHRVRELDAKAISTVHEVLPALRVVMAFGQEEREVARFSDRLGACLRERLSVLLSQSLLGSVLTVATAGGTTIILYLCVRGVQNGGLTVGEVTMILAYVGQLTGPIQSIGQHLASQQTAIAAAERAFTLIDRSDSVPEPAKPVPMGRARGSVTFQGVGFAYDDRAPLFSDLDLTIPAGTKVGIVGATGSGKSTLVNLVMRLYDPTRGRLLLDGVDLRAIAVADLRRQFAVVGQDTTLFGGTVAENIAYGRPDATLEEIIAASEKAHAHDFISRLPNGYGTVLGERGMSLSGGERQRLSMARALLLDAPVLVMDEPTSALDLTTEAAIVRDVAQAAAGRTTFIVTHRPSILQAVDLVLRVEGGAVTVMEGAALRPMANDDAPVPLRVVG